MMKMAFALAAASALAGADAAQWAVIMAGSNWWYNYRHQADACHAYQVAKKHGIPESNIILLAFDDIAHNKANPFPGKIFNSPNGTNVYDGCKISYRRHTVTYQNFVKVLTGDSSATGPVLQSTADDSVFVYYADHGGPGVLGVPDGCGDFIHAKDVNDALVLMHEKNMYKELLFYIEACESGSIFAGLLEAPNVRAVTASNPKESSWGWYCPPQDIVNGTGMGTCLGDEFSINWLEDADQADLNKETVAQQFQTVKNLTTKSHVMEYGTSSFDGEPIGNFMGDSAVGQPLGSVQSMAGDSVGVNSRDAELRAAYFAMERATTAEQREREMARFEAMLMKRRTADESYALIARMVTKDEAKAKKMLEEPVEMIKNIDCHYKVVREAARTCGMDGYSMRHSRLFVNLCDEYAAEEISSSIQGVCNGAPSSLVV